MSASTNRPAPERWNLAELALLFSVIALLVPNFIGLLYWSHENGASPIKPRDYNLVVGLVVILLSLVCRPSFCLPALALITIPLMRFLDAALLERYAHITFGSHSIYVMMIAGYLLVSFTGVLALSASKGAQIAVWVAIITIVCCSLVNIYEFLGFASYTRIEGRMAGWNVDPNQSPIIMCLMFGILFTLHKRYWWNMILVVLAAAAIALSMSRSGFAIFAVMTGFYMLLHFRERLVGMIGIAIVSVPLLAIGIGVLGATSTKQGLHKNEDTSGRMEAIFEGDFDKLKSPERAKDLMDGWEAVCLQPVTGYGTGKGGDLLQPHNQFVTQWLDLGIFGIMQYLGALLTFSIACATKKFRGGFCLIPVWLFIPCSQILLEMPAYWFSFAVAAMVLFPRRIAIRIQKPSETAVAQHHAHA